MLSIGKPIPEFSLKGASGGGVKDYTSKDFLGRWWVLFFYPKDFTFICPTELKGFQTHVSDFEKLNARITGVSCDPPETHVNWAKELGGLSFPLLSDTKQEFSRMLGVLHEIEKLPVRAMFLVDPKGVVQYALASQNNVGRSVSETLRVLAALQTGRMCPADWKPGDETFDTSHAY